MQPIIVWFQFIITKQQTCFSGNATSFTYTFSYGSNTIYADWLPRVFFISSCSYNQIQFMPLLLHRLIFISWTETDCRHISHYVMKQQTGLLMLAVRLLTDWWMWWHYDIYIRVDMSLCASCAIILLDLWILITLGLNSRNCNTRN